MKHLGIFENRTKSLSFLCAGLFFLLLNSCTDDEEPAPEPTITFGATNIRYEDYEIMYVTTSVANPVGIEVLNSGHLYSATDSLPEFGKTLGVAGIGPVGSSFTSKLINYSLNKHYYVRPFVKTANGILYGEVVGM